MELQQILRAENFLAFDYVSDNSDRFMLFTTEENFNVLEINTVWHADCTSSVQECETSHSELRRPRTDSGQLPSVAIENFCTSWYPFCRSCNKQHIAAISLPASQTISVALASRSLTATPENLKQCWGQPSSERWDRNL